MPFEIPSQLTKVCLTEYFSDLPEGVVQRRAIREAREVPAYASHELAKE